MMIPDESASPIWSAMGWTMLHFLWIGAVLGALAGIGRRLLRSARAEVQYIYGLACLALLAITPPIIAVLLLSGAFTSESRPNEVAIRESIPESATASAGRMDLDPLIAPTPDRVRSTVATGRENLDPRLSPGTQVLTILALYLPYLWLVGTPLTFTYLAVGLAGAERLRRQSAFIVDPRLSELARCLADSLGVTRRVTLVTCERLSTPVLLGIVRPAILLPAVALTGWTPEQLEMALLHELVHIRRWDNLVILLQRLVESILFFHPVIWIVSGWVYREREHCCDEAVVRHTGRPLAYAEMLLALSDVKPPCRPAAVAMAEGNLVARIRRLLHPEDHSMKLPVATIALAAGSLLVPALLIGAQAALSRPDDRPRDEGAGAAPGASKAHGPDRDESRDGGLRRIAAATTKALNEPADEVAPIASAPSPAPPSPQEIREKYSAVRPKLESIRDIQMHYAYDWRIERTGVPENLKLRVRDKEHHRVEGFTKGKRIRVDLVNLDELKTTVVVVAGPDSFQVAKEAGKEDYALVTRGENERAYGPVLATASGFIEGAYKLILQLDVRDVLRGVDFEVTVPGNQPDADAVTCEFRRKRAPAPADGPAGLYVTSGRLVLLPDRDWAVRDYSLATNTGLEASGRVEYQDVDGLALKSVPKKIQIVMTRKDQPSRTEYTVDRSMVSLEPLNDRIFTLEEFGIRSEK